MATTGYLGLNQALLAFGGVGLMVLLTVYVAAVVVAARVDCLGGLLPTLVSFFVWASVPWLFILSTLRGALAHTAVGCVTDTLIRAQLVTLGLTLASLVVGGYGLRTALAVRWLFEYFSTVLILQFCWLLVWQASSLLMVLLWLELASLAVVLLLIFIFLGEPDYRQLGGKGWGGQLAAHQLQLGFLQALLTFLWTGGVAVLLLLWGFTLTLVVGSGVEHWQLLVLGLTGTSQHPVPITQLTTCVLVSGLLLKLMLQPFQFCLVMFYGQLPLGSLVFYLGSYYCYLAATVVLQLSSFLLLLGIGGPLTMVASLGLLMGVAATSLGTISDFRATLALSTLFNLTMLALVAMGKH